MRIRLPLALLVVVLLVLVRLGSSSVDPYSSSSSSGAFGDRDDEEDEVEDDDDDDRPPPPPPPPPLASSGRGGRSSRQRDLDDDADGDDDDDSPGRKLRSSSSSSSSSSNSESLVIHLVPHSHVDQGWLKTADQTEEHVFDILNSVSQHLDLDAKRRFVWAETWYFRRWYDTLANSKRERVKRLVRDGRLEFVGGGLVSAYDEALASHRLVVEQMADGHAFLQQTFGIASPRVAWQIDAFGHSDSTPALLSRLGFSAVVLNRVHFRVKQRFRKGQHLEFLWRSPKPMSSDAALLSKSSSSREDLDSSRQIFAHLLPVSYASPEGHDFERAGTRQVTAPRGRATKLLQYARDVSRAFRTHHVMIPWGDDMRFKDADKQFGNMDKIMAEVAQENPTVRIQYSTAGEYFDSVQRAATAQSLRFPAFSGDFLPYADAGDAYWAGVFSSRAQLKRWAKQAEHHLFSASFLFSFARAKSTSLGHVPKIASVEVQTGRVVVDDAKPAPSWGLGLHRSLQFAKRQAALVGTHHHAITGQAKDAVAKDFMRRAKSSIEASSRVAMESLSVLLTKRKADTAGAAQQQQTRPGLKPWSHSTDALNIKEDGRQHPVLFTNEQSVWRRELVQLRLDVANFALTKRIRIADSAGQPVAGQVHRVIVSAGGGGGGGGKDAADWKTDIVLSLVVDVPPLGFATYFVSCAASSDRLSNGGGAASAAVQAVPITVYHTKRGRITTSGNGHNNADGIKISTTLPTENANGACHGIDNDLFALEMDCDSGLVKAWVNKKTKKRTLLKQELRQHEQSRGGSALFRPDRLESSLMPYVRHSHITVGIVRGPLVHEVHLLADGLSQVVRLVRSPNSPNDLALEGHAYMTTLVAGVTPDVDIVVRFNTDLKTGGKFYTDSPSGALRERRGVPDTPLASNFYPCASGLVLRGEQRNAAPQFLGIVLSQPVACTGAATVAAASSSSEFGVIELVLHRNPTGDDGRGLGEGLSDFGVSRLDSLLYLDQTEFGAHARRAGLIHRVGAAVGADYWMAQMDTSSLLAPLLNRDVWASKFLVTASFLSSKFIAAGGGEAGEAAVRISSIFPRDETSDEVLFRVDSMSDAGAAAPIDFTQAFPAADWMVFGAREFRPRSSAQPLSFQASDRVDDFNEGGGGGGGDDKFGSTNALAYMLSEYANKEIEASAEESRASSSSSSSSKKNSKKQKNGGGGGSGGASSAASGGGGSAALGGFPGGVFPSCPVLMTAKASSSQLPSDLKRGDSKVYAVGLLYLPDDRLVLEGGKKKRAPVLPPPASSSSSSSFTKKKKVIVDEVDEDADDHHQTGQNNNNNDDDVASSLPPRKPRSSKSLTSLRAELSAEEKRSAALEVRSQRLQKNVDELLRELDLFQDIDGGLDKKAALEELNRAEEQLVEGNLMLKESRDKAAALQRELVLAEAGEEGTRRGGGGSGSGAGSSSKRHGGGNPAAYHESSLHGFFAGAGGMLLVVVAFQWFTGRRQKHRQAFVPVGVRYNPQPSGFAVPTKRL